MRKRNLSVYDIQRELSEAGQSISINALVVLLREEGFARLPRRRDQDRPVTVKPEIAAVAGVRDLDLSPRSLRTTQAGLFLFVPLLDSLDLSQVIHQAGLPGSKMIPAEQALRSLLALKLLGAERKSHVIGVPKRSYLAACSSRAGHKASLRLMDAWFQQVQPAGLPPGSSLDLDFHGVPANSAVEPLEKHYVSSRSRRQKGILVFLAQDAEQRVLRYANAGVTKAGQAGEILRFVEFWNKHTGSLPALTRIFRTPRVPGQQVTLKGYPGSLRQMSVMDLGHEEPAILLTNRLKLGPVPLPTRYAQRMLIENGISEAIQFFHIDALSSMVGMNAGFDMQLTLMASSLYRLMAQRIGREFQHAQAK